MLHTKALKHCDICQKYIELREKCRRLLGKEHCYKTFAEQNRTKLALTIMTSWGKLNVVKMTFCGMLINVYFISAGLWKLISASVLACKSAAIWSVMCWWYENGYFEIAFPLFFNCSCSFGWQNILDWQTLFIIPLYLVVY